MNTDCACATAHDSANVNGFTNSSFLTFVNAFPSVNAYADAAAYAPDNASDNGFPTPILPERITT